MDPRIVAAFIAGGFALVVALIALIPFLMKRREARVAKRSGQFTEIFFKWMDLPELARRKLEQSELIRNDKTEQALMRIVEFARADDSILAICGYKASYSKGYYRKNFESCKEVKRIFIYDAMRSEMVEKGNCFALDGLKMHLKEKEIGEKCDVEVFVVPRGKRIKDLTSGKFDPPLSFGLTILRDRRLNPKKAVIHWEIAAEPLKHLIDIEGFVINAKQKEVLKELMELHTSLAGADGVLSSKRDRIRIDAICVELDEFWESLKSAPAKEGRKS